MTGAEPVVTESGPVVALYLLVAVAVIFAAACLVGRYYPRTEK